MQKIISLFQRNYETDHLVRNEIVPGAEWVIAGEGIATRKWDGCCCKVENGILYKRYDAKNGKTPPALFIPAQDPDPVTGHWPGWLKVGEGPEDKWFREAYQLYDQTNPLAQRLDDSTYELVGPAINGNKDKFSKHILIKHGVDEYENVPRTFDELKAWFADEDFEGVVWHHPDGRMVKIKKRDFGYKW